MAEQSAGGFNQLIGRITKRSDIAFAVGLMGVLVVLILPMPSWLLDMMLAVSITLSVMVFMTAIFIEKPLEFSSFPTVLLVATMLRLSLNLASTRLILSNGHQGPDAAGNVIEAFGSFVMGGNFLIGLIVFAILVIVNFVVITKGSGRIAEVAARFTLDAMPGKQMAIDADLSAGMIDEAEARKRRSELEQESTFFGSMDGASKFVRGDAIAGLMITFINVLGGILIGTLDFELSAGEAARTYALLTVGDGLVSQIPALIVSVAAGLLVSKAGVKGSTDKALLGQLSAYPAALGICSVMMGAMGLLPGLPMIPFFALSAVTGLLAYYLPKQREQEKAKKAAELQALEREKAPPAEEPISKSLQIDQIRLELGYSLLAMMNETGEARLTAQVKGIRKQLAQDMGFVLPSVRIQDNLQLPPNTYVVKVKEVEAGRGDIRPNMLLVMDPRGEQIRLAGEQTREPTFGLPAMWVEEAKRDEATMRGYTVVDAPTVIVTHITELVKDSMAELLSYAETQKLLDELKSDHQKLVSDLIPNTITLSGVQRVLQSLLAERVSIRDLPTILEGIAEAAQVTRQTRIIAEHVRTRLGRQLCNTHSHPHTGQLPIVTLSPRWEQAFAESLIGDGEEKSLAMAPSQLQQFLNALRQIFDTQASMGEHPVLLTSPGVRPYVRSIVERVRPNTVVMSQNEIHPKARIKTLGQVA